MKRPPLNTRLEEFLEAWRADEQDGVTMRALHNKLNEHIQDDRETLTGVHNDITTIRERLARGEENRAMSWLKEAAEKPLMKILGVIFLIAASHLARCGLQLPADAKTSTSAH